MRRAIGAVAVMLAAATAALVGAAGQGDRAVYRSPYEVAWSPDGRLVAVSDRTAGCVVLVDVADRKVVREVALEGRPTGLAWSPEGKLYVAESGASSVAEVDAGVGKVLRRFAVGRYPGAVAVRPETHELLVTDWGLDQLSVIDLASGEVAAKVPVVREPRSVAVTGDGSLAVVGNCLPQGNAAEPTQSCVLSLVDLATKEVAAEVKLPPGSMQVRGVAVSPDGRWAYAVHALGRFTLPTTQLERGWVNTNALTIIDLERREHYATCLLDRLTEGAADPWGAAVSPDGKALWVTLAGVHQLCRVDLERLHLLLDGKDLPSPPEEEQEGGRPRHISQVWREIKADPARREMLVNDLAALYAAGLSERVDVGGQGARGLAIAPDGRRLAVAAYFSGEVVFADGTSGETAARVPVGRQPPADAVRRGEEAFADATHAFQHWLSCATCHPDGRADGLNWDLLNDGIGNPKNTRSLLWSHRTPPVMSLGVRSDFGVASNAGFRFILFRVPEEGDVEAVKAYLASLEPMPSPYLAADGKLSAKAERGRKLFEDPETGCATCHPGPLFTDLKSYDVGTQHALDREAKAFDTPTLVELWRTAPYLHSGEARTLLAVLTTHNKGDRHGKTSHLTPEELEALAEYLKSL